MYGKQRRSELEHIQKNAAGEYVYVGDHYRYCGETPRRRALSLLWIGAGGSALCILGAGLLPAPGMTGYWYVTVPYVLSLAAAVSLLWGLGQISAGGEPIRAFVYDTAWRRLPRRAVLTAGLAGLSTLGMGIFLLLHGPGERLLPAAGFLGLMLGSGGLAAGVRCYLPRLRWSKQS